MSKTARSGWQDGHLFVIAEKDSGEIKAEVNKKSKAVFGTWKAAERWIQDEIERRSRK